MIRIETAAKHLPQLAEFASAHFSHNFGFLYQPEALAEHLEKTCSVAFFAQAIAGGDYIALAFDGEVLVGYVKAGYLGLPVEQPEADAKELHRLYVADSHHGSGIARQLMENALSWLGNRTVYVGVWENNLRAQAFYGKYGFAPFSEYLYVVGETKDRELILRKPAPETYL